MVAYMSKRAASSGSGPIAGDDSFTLFMTASPSDPRAAFTDRLNSILLRSDVGLLSAHVVPGEHAPLWALTLRLGDGQIISVHAGLRPDQPPFDDETCQSVSRSVLTYLRQNNLLWTR